MGQQESAGRTGEPRPTRSEHGGGIANASRCNGETPRIWLEGDIGIAVENNTEKMKLETETKKKLDYNGTTMTNLIGPLEYDSQISQSVTLQINRPYCCFPGSVF